MDSLYKFILLSDPNPASTDLSLTWSNKSICIRFKKKEEVLNSLVFCMCNKYSPSCESNIWTTVYSLCNRCRLLTMYVKNSGLPISTKFRTYLCSESWPDRNGRRMRGTFRTYTAATFCLFSSLQMSNNTIIVWRCLSFQIMCITLKKWYNHKIFEFRCHGHGIDVRERLFVTVAILLEIT